MLRKILFCLIIACQLNLRGQLTHLFTSDSHLSSSLINKVLCDSRGFVWVATEDGLNKFDGNKFTIYRNVPDDSTSLAHNFVTNVFEDKDGHIIASTYVGVQIYDPLTDSFTSSPSKNRILPQNHSINDITQSHDGSIILCGKYLVQCRVTPANTLRLAHVLLMDSLTSVKIVHEDVNQRLWFSCDKNGIGFITPNGKVTKMLGGTHDPVITKFVNAADGTLYAGSNHHGLLKFDPTSEKFVQVAPASKIIPDILPNPDGSLLIATDGEGLCIYRPGNSTLLPLNISLTESDKLKVHSLDRDEYGNLWVGVYQKGLIFIPAQDNAFHTIGPRSVIPNLIGTACVSTIMRDKDGYLWVGTDNDGIYRLAPDFKSSCHYAATDGPKTIFAFYEDKKGKMWVGSYDKGVGTLDPATGRYHRVPIHEASGREVNSVFAILADKNDKLFIGTMGSGLYVFNPEKATFEPYNLDDYYNPWITTMKYSPEKDMLYIGSYDGAFAISSQKEIMHLLPSMIITSLYIDRKGQVWAGTTDGLIQLPDKPGEEPVTFNTEDRLYSHMVHGIQSDGDNLWVSTNSGIGKFNPETNELQVFTVNDGLQANEFYKNSSYCDANGRLYFGGLNGLTFFDPTEIQGKGAQHEVRITDFFVGGVPVKSGEMVDGHVVTDKPIYDTDTFYLGPNVSSFAIDFTIKDALCSAQPTFQYSFDNSPWQTLPQRNQDLLSGAMRLTFSQMNAGKHTLQIRVIDNGVVSSISSYNFVIAHHWYASWWAIMIYALVLMGIAIVLLWIWRQRHLQRLRDMERDRQEEIKEAKLQFFTNVSHEIKTPMSLVISPVEQLMEMDDNPERQKSYRTILRNSKRILRLVNEIMDLRKIDNSQMRMTFTRVQIVPFIQDLLHTFENAAAKKKIELSFSYTGCEGMETDIDMANLDKVVMNMLSNAIKYTPEGGKVNIDLSKSVENGRTMVHLAVTDTGIGIPENERKNIFERFYRVANNNASGTGIGLHLAYRLMQLHDGNISVEDNPEGKGIRFVATWPLHTTLQQDVPLYSSKPVQSTRNLETLDIGLDAADIEEVKSGRRKRHLIYLVEDDKEITAYLTQQLGQVFKIQSYSNGQEALDAIYEHTPDLVITDIMMPKMDGFTLTRRIRENIQFNHLPVIMLTAKTQDEDLIQGFDSGADAYISKPFNINLLYKRAEALIQSHQRLRNVYSGQQDRAAEVEAPEATSHDDQLMERLMKVINQNLSNSDITIEMIAQEVGISRVHLHRKLKEITNQTTRDFLRNIRLQKAAEIMKQARINVSEVSDMVGFKNPNNFSTSFKEMYGMTPSEFLSKHWDK